MRLYTFLTQSANDSRYELITSKELNTRFNELKADFPLPSTPTSKDFEEQTRSILDEMFFKGR